MANDIKEKPLSILDKANKRRGKTEQKMIAKQ